MQGPGKWVLEFSHQNTSMDSGSLGVYIPAGKTVVAKAVPVAASSCGYTEGVSGCPAMPNTESEGSQPSQTPSGL